MSRQQFVRICECGCGQPTLLASKTFAARGWVKGQPTRALRGHLGGRRSDQPQYLIDTDTGCWIWQRYRDHNGYGRMHGKKAHRVLYERHIGPIPDGLHIDHLCCVTSCVNPDHLEPVTCAENSRRQRQRQKASS